MGKRKSKFGQGLITEAAVSIDNILLYYPCCQ